MIALALILFLVVVCSVPFLAAREIFERSADPWQPRPMIAFGVGLIVWMVAGAYVCHTFSGR